MFCSYDLKAWKHFSVKSEAILFECLKKHTLFTELIIFRFSDGLTDCADSECCIKDECKDSLMCLSAPDPLDILLRKQPPAVTATFYQKMKFLIEEDSVQSYAHRDEYSERYVKYKKIFSVIQRSKLHI